MSEKAVSYGEAGVDYETLDAAKRAAMALAASTSDLMLARGATALDESRGEPAFCFELDGRVLALVVEGLGTKSIIARQVLEELAVNRFADVAYDTVAAILGDLACVGALPLACNAYFATGDSSWYEQEERSAALVAGWRRGCDDAGCTWGGGESPSLAGLVEKHEVELAGAAVGALPPGRAPLLGAELREGDEIILLASTGLHANGASLARAVAAQLPDGYATRLPSGRTFGEALLDPAPMYSRLVAQLQEQALDVHYHSHITGHGLLKLMRPRRELTYRIEVLPEVPEVLAFLAAEAGMDAAVAHSTLNMGTGWAVYSAPDASEQVLAAAAELGFTALRAGRVEGGPRRVILQPLGVTYDGERLALSA